MPDPKEWRFYVTGDFRSSEAYDNPLAKLYEDDPKGRFVVFGGAAGFYWYCKKEYHKAVEAWEIELEAIAALEEEKDGRLHKGWFYYMMSLAYREYGMESNADRYLWLAMEEDRLSYGDRAGQFPASTKAAS